MIKNLALVDDDEIYTFLTTKAIQAGSSVEQIRVFTNGKDILNYLKENSNDQDLLPEVILLDLFMPIMDGWQFLDEFQKIKQTLAKKINIFICSSSISPDDLAKANSISIVSEFLFKPVTKEKLRELLEKN